MRDGLGDLGLRQAIVHPNRYMTGQRRDLTEARAQQAGKLPTIGFLGGGIAFYSTFLVYRFCSARRPPITPACWAGLRTTPE